ncbi:MAG: outer membrane protein assembly factor BamB family protein [Deltaproteobacteria bacterium]
MLCPGCPSEGIALTGNGIQGQLTFTPNPIAFGNVPTSQTSSLTITATNSGNATLTLVSVATQSGGANGFSVSGLPAGFPATPLQMIAGQSFTFTASFTASSGTAPSTDTLLGIFWVTGPTDTHTATDPMTANHVPNPCTLSAAPTSVSFGYVAASSSTSRTVTLSNGGQTACHVSGLAMAAGSDPWFSLQAGTATSFAVAPGASAPVALVFAPQSSAPPSMRRATLAIASDDPVNPTLSVPLVATTQDTAYATSSWPKWHHDSGNTGLSDVDTTQTSGTVRWRVQIGPAPCNSGSAILPSCVTQTYVNGPSIAADGTLYQLGFDGHLYAINPADGGVVWKTAVVSDADQAAVESTPTVAADNSIYLIAGGEVPGAKQYYHLGPDGGILSSMSASSVNGVDDDLASSPVIDPSGRVLVAGDESEAAIVFQNDAVSAQWPLCAPTDGGSCSDLFETFSGAVASDGSSYWSGQGFAVGLGPTGSLLWQAQPFPQIDGHSGDPEASPALANGTIYVAPVDYGLNLHYGGGLFALNPATGATLWSYVFPLVSDASGPGPVVSNVGLSSPAVLADNGIVVGYVDGVYCIDPPTSGSTGILRWKVPLPQTPYSGGTLSSPAIGSGGVNGHGTVYIGSMAGTLLAIDAKIGAVDWTFSVPNRASDGLVSSVDSSPAIGADGTLYFMADDGFLYALR